MRGRGSPLRRRDGQGRTKVAGSALDRDFHADHRRYPARPDDARTWPGCRPPPIRRAHRAHRSNSRSPGSRRGTVRRHRGATRSEEHTSELQSLMRISYAVFCLQKKNERAHDNTPDTHVTIVQIIMYETRTTHTINPV